MQGSCGLGQSSPSTQPGKPLSRLLPVPVYHEQTEFAVIHFLPYVFQGIFYLARTITLLQYKLGNNSLVPEIYIVIPTILENIFKKMPLSVLGTTLFYYKKRLITLRGQNLDGFFCDASTNIPVFHFPLALNLALLFCSLSKQGT